MRFNTEEEAQLAWRLLGQMASDHADRTRTSAVEHSVQTRLTLCKHDFKYDKYKLWRCEKCGMRKQINDSN